MNDVIRFDPVGTIEGFEESEFGKYVFADDYDTAFSQLAALREELAATKNGYKWESERAAMLLEALNNCEADLAQHSSFESLYTAAIDERDVIQQRLADAERRNDARDAEIAAQIESALRRSFSLGQVYWQQADSDSTYQQNKSDQTMEVQAQHILNVLKSISAALNPKP